MGTQAQWRLGFREDPPSEDPPLDGASSLGAWQKTRVWDHRPKRAHPRHRRRWSSCTPALLPQRWAPSQRSINVYEWISVTRSPVLGQGIVNCAAGAVASHSLHMLTLISAFPNCYLDFSSPWGAGVRCFGLRNGSCGVLGHSPSPALMSRADTCS